MVLADVLGAKTEFNIHPKLLGRMGAWLIVATTFNGFLRTFRARVGFVLIFFAPSELDRP